MECLAEMALEILQHKQAANPGQLVTDHMVDRYILPAFYGMSWSAKRSLPDELSSIGPLLA
jgi:hypothetical protein